MKADMVLKSRYIYTVSTGMVSGAVAIKDNRIVYVGSLRGLEEYMGEETRVYEYGEKMILPGFIDAHIHFFMSALSKQGRILLIDGESELECIENTREFLYRFEGRDWIITQGWYYPFWKDGEMPTKKSLDEAFGSRPVAMISADGHTLWMNSAGIEKLGIDENTIPPRGGSYEKGPDGQLTGIFYETAGLAATTRIMEERQPDLEEAFERFHKYLAEHGVTTVCDLSMMSTEGPDQIKEDIYRKLLEKEVSRCRMILYPTITGDLKRPLQLREEYTDDRLRFGGVKQFFDGVSSTHTASLMEPYTNAYFEGDCGNTVMEPDEMRELIHKASEHQMPIRIHTIGDRAIHLALDYMEEAREKYGKNPIGFNTLEHLENILPEDIKRLSSAGVIASVQPGHALLDTEGVRSDLGEDRVRHMWAFREFLDQGVTLAFGTDAPIMDINPMLTLYYAVNRMDLEGQPEGGWQPHQKIQVEEAIEAYTLGAAKACGMEKKLGTIEVGKLADLVVLEQDITCLKPELLPNVKIFMTIMDGKTVYLRND